MSTLLFYFFALVILGSALKMVFSTNLVHSALFMVVTFIGVACIYLLLYADFIALVQLLVYVGAVSVLLVFGVMLTRRGNMSESNLFNRYKAVAGIIIAVLFVVIARALLAYNWPAAGAAAPGTGSTVPQIAQLLLSDYALPFEAAGILLLSAVIGAIVIGKGAGSSK